MSQVERISLKKIEPPKNCPSCDSALEQVKDQLFCRNSTCSAQASKKVEHFAKVLKIKGLGPATIEKLDIQTIDQIYGLELEYVVNALGEKLATKLLEEIEKSKEASLNQILPAFGIPLIGNTASQKICSEIKSIEELDEEACIRAGLGPKAMENLMNWFEKDYLSDLPFSYISEQKIIKDAKGIVCISGKLSSFKTKAQAQKALEEAGYTVKSSVTKEVTILVNESGVESSKTKKARDSGVEIITNLTELIGN